MLLGTILCKFGQICATGNAFVRLVVGRNSILNFPAKIWTGICRALLCGDDSSHSQGQSRKRLLLAFRGHPIRSPTHQGTSIGPTYWPHMLDLAKMVWFFQNPLTIRLLKKDYPSGNDFMQVWTNLCYRECFCNTNSWKELHFELPRTIPKFLYWSNLTFPPLGHTPTMPLGPGAHLQVIFYKLIHHRAFCCCSCC